MPNLPHVSREGFDFPCVHSSGHVIGHYASGLRACLFCGSWTWAPKLPRGSQIVLGEAEGYQVRVEDGLVVSEVIGQHPEEAEPINTPLPRWLT